MFKAFKYRLYPNAEQKVLLDRHFGSVRFIYNLALETKKAAYSGQKHNLSAYDLNKQLTELKTDLPWLNDISRNALEMAVFNMEASYKKFFKGGGYPNFKSKKDRQSFTVRNNIHILDNTVHFPKFQDGIKIVKHRDLVGEIKSATISKSITGKYYVSILAICEDAMLPKTNNSIGIDLGIKTFAVTSNGKEYDSPKFLRNSLKRLSVLQRRSSRKVKGSNNRKKANIKIALLYEKITNQRKHFSHNISKEITNQNDIICVEDLSVKNMVQNHKLALSISDAGWSMFIKQLEYKSKDKGRSLIKIGRFEPSTKMCSSCGNVQDIKLSERIYNCSCGLSIDRDYNAALNIRNLGILRANSLSS